jgi:hypothetical protein
VSKSKKTDVCEVKPHAVSTVTKGICFKCVHYHVPWHYCKKEHAMMPRRGFATDCTAFKKAEPAKQEGWV